MAIRKIVLVPDPILKEKARPVTKFTERLHKLLDDMAETMYDAPVSVWPPRWAFPNG